MGKKEEFVLHKSNAAAYMLAEMIIENEKEHLVNPAIIFGESGNGKSHIVEIIREGITEKGKKVKVVNADEFTSELIDTIKCSEFPREDFYKKYDDIDVLVIEDLQYLQGKKQHKNIWLILLNDYLRKGISSCYLR